MYSDHFLFGNTVNQDKFGYGHGTYNISTLVMVAYMLSLLSSNIAFFPFDILSRFCTPYLNRRFEWECLVNPGELPDFGVSIVLELLPNMHYWTLQCHD